MSIAQKALKDYLSRKFLGLSFVVFLAPLLIFALLLVFGGMEIFSLLEEVSEGNVDAQEYPFLFKMLQYSIVHWLLTTLFYALGGFLVVLLSLLVAMVAIGFLTPRVVKHVHQVYYPHVAPYEISSLGVLKLSFWLVFKFLLLFLICLPLIFVPFMINVPFFYLFYKFLLLDVGSNILSQDELRAIEKEDFLQLLGTSLVFFALSLIPFFGIFIQLFFVLYFAHYFFTKKEKGLAS